MNTNDSTLNKLCQDLEEITGIKSKPLPQHLKEPTMNEFKSIDEALNSINFQAISNAMSCLNWTYCSTVTPTPTELKEVVFELYNGISTLQQDPTDSSKQFASSSTGGFTVTKAVYDDDPELIGVSFTISQNLLLKDN